MFERNCMALVARPKIVFANRSIAPGPRPIVATDAVVKGLVLIQFGSAVRCIIDIALLGDKSREE